MINTDHKTTVSNLNSEQLTVVRDGNSMIWTAGMPLEKGDILMNLSAHSVKFAMASGAKTSMLGANGIIQILDVQDNWVGMDPADGIEVAVLEGEFVLAQAETAAAAAGSGASSAAGVAAASSGMTVAAVGAAAAVAVAAGGGGGSEDDTSGTIGVQQTDEPAMDAPTTDEPPTSEPDPEPEPEPETPVAEDPADPSAAVELGDLYVKLSAFKLDVHDVGVVPIGEEDQASSAATAGGLITIADGTSNPIAQADSVELLPFMQTDATQDTPTDESPFGQFTPLTENEDGTADINLGVVEIKGAELLGASSETELLPLENTINLLVNLAQQAEDLIDADNLQEILTTPIGDLVEIKGLEVADVPVLSDTDSLLDALPAVSELDTQLGTQLGEDDSFSDSYLGEGFDALRVIDESIDIPGVFGPGQEIFGDGSTTEDTPPSDMAGGMEEPAPTGDGSADGSLDPLVSFGEDLSTLLSVDTLESTGIGSLFTPDVLVGVDELVPAA